MTQSRVTMRAAVAAVSLATLAAVVQLGAANPQAWGCTTSTATT